MKPDPWFFLNNSANMHPTPTEVECRFSVLSGYLQCSTECRLLAIFSADWKSTAVGWSVGSVHPYTATISCMKMTKMNQGRNRVPWSFSVSDQGSGSAHWSFPDSNSVRFQWALQCPEYALHFDGGRWPKLIAMCFLNQVCELISLSCILTEYM